MAKNKKIFISMLCLAGLLLVFGFSFQKSTQACAPNTLCVPDGSLGIANPSDPDNAVANVLKKVLNWMLSILGVIGVISFVISGFQYLTSYGNESQIERAKSTMKYSIIGIVVAIAGLVIVQTLDFLISG